MMAVRNALVEELVANPRRSDAEVAQSRVGGSVFEHIRIERLIVVLRFHIVALPLSQSYSCVGSNAPSRVSGIAARHVNRTPKEQACPRTTMQAQNRSRTARSAGRWLPVVD